MTLRAALTELSAGSGAASSDEGASTGAVMKKNPVGECGGRGVTGSKGPANIGGHDYVAERMRSYTIDVVMEIQRTRTKKYRNKEMTVRMIG